MNPLSSVAAAMTDDARAALARATVSRRAFIKGSGALIVGFAAAEFVGQTDVAPDSALAQRGAIDGPGSNRLDAWVAIAADGAVVAYTGKCEFGQGLYTAQQQLVAEELCVAFDRVTLVQCDTAVTPDQGTTSGAQSHPTNFNAANLALACATAREALLERAGSRLSLPVAALTARNGAIVVTADPSKTVSYGDLVGGRTFGLTLNPAVRRRPSSEWTVLGTDVPRVDLPAIVTGQFEYVHDVRVPGMVHGRVVRPPAVGSAVIAVDEDSVQGMPGVLKVVVKGNFVGVVAAKPWQAIQAAEALKVSWTAGSGLPAFASFHEQVRRQTPSRDTVLVDSNDVEERLAGAAKIVTATYLYPYQMHGSIGTSCAVADVRSDGVRIWSSTQAVHPLKSSVARILGVPAESVRVTYVMGSGCYGINGADTVSYDAALLSQAVGRPVRVQLSRKDEMAWENYGYAFVIEERAGLSADGTVAVWDHECWFPSLGGRPGTNQPGNVVTGMLAGFDPSGPVPRTPAPEPTGYANNTNAVPSYVTGSIAGRLNGTGTVRSERVRIHNVRSPLFTGQLRAPERLQNTFAHESFIDELAAVAKSDPLAYRIRHLTDARLKEVLQAAAKAAAWDSRLSPRPGIRRAGIAEGRGLSSVLYYGDNGYCAIVAYVDVDQDSGHVVVKRLVIAIDCGPISNPDGLRNQLEGGALQGISRTLLEEVTWDDEQVTSVDWRTYRPLYLGVETPAIEVVLLNRSDGKATGAGETSITLVGAAIANAIFDATGARLRQVPFTPERVRAALARR